MLLLQGAVFGGGIYNPGRCPGLSDVALSGRWIASLADAPFRAMVCASCRRVAGRMPAYPGGGVSMLIYMMGDPFRVDADYCMMSRGCFAHPGYQEETLSAFFRITLL